MSEFHFQKKSHLLNSKQFDAVFSQAEIKVSSKYILLLARHNSLPYSRLGLVIPKKKIRFANGRNRTKRVLREYFRLNQTQFKGLDLIALARGNFTDLENAEQLPHIHHLYQKLIVKQQALAESNEK